MEMTENEKKKEYLRSYRAAKRREKYILEEIQRLRADKMFPSLVADGMPHGSGGGDLARYMELVEEQIEKLGKERLETAEVYTRIERQIRQMENETEKEVLRLRYIRGMKWEEIAAEMGYSWKQIHRIHGSALSNFKMT